MSYYISDTMSISSDPCAPRPLRPPIVDTKMPTNDMAWVTLSVPDRKVLQMQRDIGCGTIAAARKLAKELQAKFTPLKFEGGPKSLEIMKGTDASVSVQLSDADFGKELNDWLKKVE